MINLLAQTDGTMGDRIVEALVLMGVGMLVVFSALMLLWLAIFVIDRLAERLQPAPAAKPAPAPPTTSAPRPTPQRQTHDPQLLAVLAAAATTALGKRVRLRQVHFVSEEHESWAQEGRRDVMSGHSPHLHKRR
jgi:sodium pump decarboxylase gamma subunit